MRAEGSAPTKVLYDASKEDVDNPLPQGLPPFEDAFDCTHDRPAQYWIAALQEACEKQSKEAKDNAKDKVL